MVGTDENRSERLPALQADVPVLQIQGLSIDFGERRAVEDLSFSIAAGETLGLVGESGSGKSATSLAVMRLLGAGTRVAGEIRFEGEDLLGLSEAAMRRKRGREIAMIFQEPMTALNPVMPVGAQIAEAVRAHGGSGSRRAVKEQVLEAMRQVALPDPERTIRISSPAASGRES